MISWPKITALLMRLHQLTQAEDFVEDYGFPAGGVHRILLAEEYDKHDEDYAHGYDAIQDAETDLDKQEPGCGPPLGVNAKVVNETSFNVSWYAETPQNVSIKYFMLEYNQAKKENQSDVECRQWVGPESAFKNQTHSFHSYLLTELTKDHFYQFRVVTYYEDYQIYSSPSTSWFHLK